MQKKSLRILITEECNFNCAYCCNKMPKVRRCFRYKKLNDINFRKYDSICITGGEPFKYIGRMSYVAWKAADFVQNQYLYTNGSLINSLNFKMLRWFDGVSVGVHDELPVEQIKFLTTINNVRFLIDREKVERYRDIIHLDRIKLYTLNECYETDREDWVVLK